MPLTSIKALLISSTILTLVMLCIIPASVTAQQATSDEPAVNHSLTYGWQMQAGAGTAGDLPFWLYSNQWGQIDRYSANSTLNLFGTQEYVFNSGISLKARGDLMLRTSQRSNVHFNEGYIQIGYGYFELWAGRKHENFGLIHPQLSTGSMDVSQNARPIPQIAISTRGFMPVPFTQGFLYADASLGHGWLNDKDFRYVEGVVRVHRKHLYLRIFNENSPLVLHGGLKHFAQWGGTSPIHGNSPVNFSSFIDVFFSRAADSREIIGGGNLLNSAQNHLGTYDFAVLVNTDRYAFSLSRQFMLEDTPNARFGTPWDGLWGATISLRPPESPRSWRRSNHSPTSTANNSSTRLNNNPGSSDFRPLLKSIHYEYLDVKEGMSRFPRRARDDYFNYYNHWAYRGGWTYHNQNIGNSLFLTDRDYLGVVNNEIIGHHVGLKGYAGIVDWRFFTTYSRNYGASRATLRSTRVGRENLQTERRDQWSFMLELNTSRLFSNLETGVKLAYDAGDVHSQNIGAMFSVRWTSRSR